MAFSGLFFLILLLKKNLDRSLEKKPFSPVFSFCCKYICLQLPAEPHNFLDVAQILTGIETEQQIVSLILKETSLAFVTL